MDFADERAEEMERDAVLEISGISIEIPEELVSEGMELMCSPRETVLDMWKALVSSRYGDSLREESEKPGFDKEVAEFLNDDLDFYRPAKEMERDIILKIDGINVEIPEKMIEERMKLMYMNSVEEATKDARVMAEAFASSLSPEEKLAPDFKQRVLKYLDCDVDVYRR